MNRQEAVITIAKINRQVKQIYYWIDLDEELGISTIDPEVVDLSTWVDQVYDFLKETPIILLAEQVLKIGPVKSIEDYLNERNGTIDARVRPHIQAYTKSMHNLEDLCKKIVAEQYKDFPDLVPALANEEAAALLGRAVDAHLLDKKYMPLKETTSAQLRVIAFAVGTLLGFPERQMYYQFERQWNRAAYRVSTVDLPRLYHCDKHLFAMSLYPEVNFTKITTSYRENNIFYTSQGIEKKKRLYDDLIKFGYIDIATKFENFIGIFDSEKFQKPIEWIAEQRYLTYFIWMTFSKENPKNIWVKTMCCFRIQGHEPHKGTMGSSISFMRRKNLLEKYNPELRTISERFNRENYTKPLTD